MNDPRRDRAPTTLADHDGAPDKALDELTKLLALLTHAPIAFISLFEGQRQGIISSVGCTTAEIAQFDSLCTAACACPDVLVVLDAPRDEQYATHPGVIGQPFTRFYAGTAIRNAENETVGLVCVVDTEPRTSFPSELEQLLRVVSQQITTQLGLQQHARQLAEREQLLSAIFDAETECVKLIRPDGTLQFMNRAGLELIEATSMDQVQEIPVLDLVVPEARNHIRDVHEEALTGVICTAEYELVSLTGTRRWMEMCIAPLRDYAGAITGTLAVSRDLTAQRNVQESLRASEAQLAAAQARAHLGSWETDFAAGKTTWSAEMWRLHHQAPRTGAPDADKYLDYVHPDDRERVALRQRRLDQTTEPVTYEYRTSPAVGPVRHLEATVTPLLDDQQHVVGLAGTAIDITERKHADRRLRRLTESNAQGVTYWTSTGGVNHANDAFLNIIGYTRDEMDRGEVNWVDITPAEYAARDQNALQEMAATGLCTPYEKEFVRRDGTRVPVLVGGAAFEDQPSEGVGFVFDLTEHKKLERQYLRAQRLESIGTLAGGIAHDMNNVLAPILLSLELLQPDLHSEESLQLLESVRESAERGATMVRQLLTFARGIEGKKRDVDVSNLITSVQRIVNDTFLKNIALRTNVASEIWTIHGDATQLHQLMLNLCVNARDAMPNGGALDLTVENCVVNNTTRSAHPDLRHGSYVRFTVKDTGTGIPKSIVDQVFDPFFSTKAVEKGTGLGLTTSLAIAKGHGGNIYVDSEEGRGTTITVMIPALNAPIAPASPIPRMHLQIGNGELVLLVDDEGAIRRVTQGTLEMFGYRVLTAANGAEAIKLFREHQTEIAILLTDMMMPDMDGRETIHAIRQLRPDLPIIATSGLDSLAQDDDSGLLRVNHFLAKPFSVEQLLTVLHDALNLP